MIGMHPGEYLREFLTESEISQKDAAEKLGVSAPVVSRILAEKSSITVDMALRLECAFGRSAESWLGMQQAFDLAQARAKRRLTPPPPASGPAIPCRDAKLAATEQPATNP